MQGVSNYRQAFNFCRGSAQAVRTIKKLCRSLLSKFQVDKQHRGCGHDLTCSSNRFLWLSAIYHPLIRATWTSSSIHFSFWYAGTHPQNADQPLMSWNVKWNSHFSAFNSSGRWISCDLFDKITQRRRLRASFPYFVMMSVSFWQSFPIVLIVGRLLKYFSAVCMIYSGGAGFVYRWLWKMHAKSENRRSAENGSRLISWATEEPTPILLKLTSHNFREQIVGLITLYSKGVRQIQQWSWMSRKLSITSRTK